MSVEQALSDVRSWSAIWLTLLVPKASKYPPIHGCIHVNRTTHAGCGLILLFETGYSQCLLPVLFFEKSCVIERYLHMYAFEGVSQRKYIPFL